MVFVKIFYFFHIFYLIILSINASPWSGYNNNYGGNEINSRFWSRLPPSMTSYGQFGRFYGNNGMQGLRNPFYNNNNYRPIGGSYSPYNNYFPLYGGQQQLNRFGSYPFNGGYRGFGGGPL